MALALSLSESAIIVRIGCIDNGSMLLDPKVWQITFASV
jgi:hypothetical protein